MERLIDPKKYEQFCKEACIKTGLSEEVSAVTANLLVRTDMLGTFTHGTLNLFPYLKKVPAGGINLKAKPEIVSEGPAWAVVDGNNAMGVYNGHFGMQVGIEKAKKEGVAYVGIRGSGHYGACGIYAITAAEQGMIALVMSNTTRNMSVPGGKGPVVGNSPIAYAVPAGSHRPVFMDIATSNVAGMKVHRKIDDGEKVPEGWIVDGEGRPTTDPAVKGWSLCPMGGHKGYCISFFIEVMCAVLTGGAVFGVKPWMDPAQAADVSHSLMLVNVPDIMDNSIFGKRMEDAIKLIAGSPKAEGSDRIYLPGEIEWDRYEKAEKEGLELPADIIKNARALAQMTGLNFESCFTK